jgi:hypothetical protein
VRALAIVLWVLVGILFIGVLIPTPIYINIYKESTEYAQQHCASHNNIDLMLGKIGNAIFDAGFWTAIATIAIACFTWTLKRSTDRLWAAAKDQIAVANAGVEVAKNTYIAGHRTWLRIYPIEVGPVTFEESQIRMTITIEAENIGGSPAIAVNLGCKPYRGRGFMVSRSAVESLIAEEKVISSFRSGMSGVVLMAGEKTSCRFTADAETDASTEAKANEQESLGVPAANHSTTLSAAYCVIYKSVASDDWRHTGHIIWLTKKDRTDFDAALGAVTANQIKATVLPRESSLA